MTTRACPPSPRTARCRWSGPRPTPRSVELVTELLGGRIAAANAELAQFSGAELGAIRRFLLASTERHNRSAATLRALPPVRAAL
ncbi:MAG TPA: hypothetical protein VF223_04380 [Trebonia sp.]